MQLRGRDIELEEVSEAVGRRGEPLRIVVVDGAAGAGHSAFLEHVAAAARRRGVPARLTRGHRTGPAAGDVSLADGECLVVDDAHWLDAPALEALVDHVRRGTPAGSVVLGVADGWATPPVDALLAELRATGHATLVRLGPLTGDAASALVADHLCAGDDAEIAACVAAGGGSPKLLVALAEHARRPPAEAVPPRVRALVASRLAWLGEDATAAAHAIAILGDTAALRHVAVLAGLERHAAERAADRLVRTRLCQEAGGLVTAGVSFTAPVVAAAVTAELEPFARSSLHDRAARLLSDEDAAATRVADHLVETQPGHDPAVVARLVAAAEAVGEPRAAVRYLRRALAEPPAAPQRAAVVTALALAEGRAGDAVAAGRIDAALATTSDRSARVALLREGARQAWLTGRPAEAVRYGEHALAEAPEGASVHGEVVAELLAAISMHDIAALREVPALTALLARAADGWVPDSAALAATLAIVVPFTLSDHRLVLPLAERALEEPLWPVDAPPYGLRPDFVIGGLRFTDEPRRAAALVDEGLAVAEAGGDALRLGQYSYWRADLALTLGELDLAVSAGDAAVRAGTGGYSAWVAYAAAMAALAHLERGEGAAAAAALDAAGSGADPGGMGAIVADDARARVLLAAGRAREALALTLDIGERLTELGQRDGPVLCWRAGATTAAAATGETTLALRLAAEEVAIARATHYRGRLGPALRLAAGVDPPRRLELLEEAVAVLATTARRLEHAHALADLGDALTAGERPAAAREVLAEARELAEACGAHPLAARALAALRATGARPRRAARTGPASLTRAERRIVELAAGGLTNRQIAERLVLAPRTVEWHLGRAYAKLGVASRRELAVALGG